MYVRAPARVRTHGLLGCRLSSRVFQFPGVLRARQMGGGDARWRQPRTPAPASRCSTARPGEWRGGQGRSGLARSGLARPGRAAYFSQQAERLRDAGTDWGRTARRAGRRVEEPGAWSPGPETEETQTWGALRCSLRQSLGRSAGCRGASGPWPRTYLNSWVSAWCSCGARYLPPCFLSRARTSPLPGPSPSSVPRIPLSLLHLFCGTCLSPADGKRPEGRDGSDPPRSRQAVVVGMNPFQPFSSSWEQWRNLI